MAGLGCLEAAQGMRWQGWAAWMPAWSFLGMLASSPPLLSTTPKQAGPHPIATSGGHPSRKERRGIGDWGRRGGGGLGGAWVRDESDWWLARFSLSPREVPWMGSGSA